jgi:hypothetical protein
MIDDDESGALSGIKICIGDRIAERNWDTVTLCPTTNLTFPDLGSNPDCRGGKPQLTA